MKQNRKLLKLLFSIILFFLLASGYSQTKNTTVVFKYKKDPDTSNSYNFFIRKPLNKAIFEESSKLPMEVASTVCKGDTCITTCKYLVVEPTCAIVGDLYGHEIIILPNDSIEITFGNENRFKLAGKFVKQWGHDLRYKGKNKYVYSLFDSLANFNGDLRNGSFVRLSHTTTRLDSFCNEVKIRYQDRLTFLENYARRHNIPNKIKLLAETEISSAYIMNLITPIVSRRFKIDAYQSEYLKTIKSTIVNNEQLFFNTFLYHQLAYELSQVSEDKKLYNPKENFISTFDRIREKHSKKIAEQLLTLHLINFSNSEFFEKEVDSLFYEFKKISLNKRDVSLVESSIRKRNVKPQIEYSLNQALATDIIDFSGKLTKLKSLFGKKPIILICWASWCRPCIEQIPFEKALEKNFGNQIDFIYISFDKRKEDWKSKSSELKLTKNNFLIQSNFKSGIANYYRITSIPRYLVYDRLGNIKDTNELRPSDKLFNSIIKKLIL